MKMTLTCLEKISGWLTSREEVMNFQKRAEPSPSSAPALPLGVSWFPVKTSFAFDSEEFLFYSIKSLHFKTRVLNRWAVSFIQVCAPLAFFTNKLFWSSQSFSVSHVVMLEMFSWATQQKPHLACAFQPGLKDSPNALIQGRCGCTGITLLQSSSNCSVPHLHEVGLRFFTGRISAEMLCHSEVRTNVCTFLLVHKLTILVPCSCSLPLREESIETAEVWQRFMQAAQACIAPVH